LPGVTKMLLNYWWCEGSATSIEDVVFPAVNDYLNWVNGSQGIPSTNGLPAADPGV